MKRIIDISMALESGMVTWPGDPAVQIERFARMEEGSMVNMTRMDLSVHSGTHVDAPYHFLADGTTVETLPLELLTGPAQVVEIPGGVRSIDAQVVDQAGIAPGVERVLFKTGNQAYASQEGPEFQKDFVAIVEGGAERLVQMGVRLIGIDYLSVAPFDNPAPTHYVLLNAGTILLEGLDLSQAAPGMYDLYCLPLKINRSDGAPARAILISREV